ncbi:MAG: substrate-binding domain-containing protein, partial [Planctomycetota bacterium]|nr:substrate-binding domain-containing protein [Planctomycetota bacterium]
MDDFAAQVQFVKENVRARIIRAELAEGARIDAPELRRATGSTVRAVRRALKELAHEGILSRRQRLGTFVAGGVARAGTSPLPPVRAIGILTSLHRATLERNKFARDTLDGIAFGLTKPMRIEFCAHESGPTRSINSLPNADAEVLRSLVQGVIAIEANDAGRLNDLARAGLPVVAIDFHDLDAAFDSVHAGHEDAGFQAAAHLIALGHRRIAFVGERCNPQSTDPTWQQRMTGYLRAMAWAGGETPRPLVLGGPRDTTSLRRFLPEFHARHRPTAYVLASAGWAADLLAELGRLGLACPRDVSLACCDFGSERVGELALSHARADYERAGRLAVQLVASRLACRAMPPVRATIPFRFVPGESSRALGGAEGVGAAPVSPGGLARAGENASDLVVLVDPSGRETGLAPKLAAHERGDLHRAFSVFVFHPDGRAMLQQRAFAKYHSGGLWSNACC